jgi:hypothetical protein
MKKIIYLSFFMWILFIKTSVFPCSGIFGADSNHVFAGNNEDYFNPMTKIWVKPAGGNADSKWKYGVLFFGYDNYFPQGGVNDQGLFFDYFALDPLKVTKSLNKPYYAGGLIEKCMRTCTTVEEVISIYDKYNRSNFEKFQLFLCDKTGNSAIIEGDDVIRKNGKYQIVTNFRQSLTPPYKITCPRYLIAKEILDKRKDISKESFLEVMAAVHQEGDWGGTLYTNIHDLKNGLIYLYYFHDYSHEVVLDLKKEFEKGYHEYDLPSLFQKNYAADNFLKNFQQQKIITHPAIASEKLKEYIGYYQSSGYYRQGYIPAEFAVFMVNNKLFLSAAIMSGMLLPESETKFLFSNINTVNTSVSVEFKKEASGKQTAVINVPDQLSYPFERVPSDKWIPSLHANTPEPKNYKSIIKDIWINDAEGFALGDLFTRKATPAFSFTLPVNSQKIATDHPSQIMAMRAPLKGSFGIGNVTFQAAVLNIPDSISSEKTGTIEQLGAELYLSGLKKIGSYHLLKSTEEIKLKDGTKAFRAIFHWYWTDESPLATILVFAQKGERWVYIATHSARDYMSIRGASSIAESLIFQ